MRIVLQRVSRARVSVGERCTGTIGRGILLLLGVHRDDTEAEADHLAARCARLRIFRDAQGKMNRSVREVDGAALVVSQFTLYGDCRKGRRPSYTSAAAPEKARELYEYFVRALKQYIPRVETGEFGAMMDVEMVNDGPVTLLMDRCGSDSSEL